MKAQTTLMTINYFLRRFLEKFKAEKKLKKFTYYFLKPP
jgi:hypothetical protein